MIRAFLIFISLLSILHKKNLICSLAVLRFVLSIEVLSVEGYDIQVDFDHGAQLSQEGSTQKESEGETQLVPFQEGFHLTVKESIAATRTDFRVPSLSRSSLSSSSSRSNVHHDKCTMEVLRLQATEETVSASLPYVQYAMAPCYRPDICPWSEKLPELAERSGAVCESLARQSNVATAKCTLGPTWQQSAQNSEKEVEAEERQGQQDPSRRTTSSARSYAAESTDDGDANGLPRSNATLLLLLVDSGLLHHKDRCSLCHQHNQ